MYGKHIKIEQYTCSPALRHGRISMALSGLRNRLKKKPITSPTFIRRESLIFVLVSIPVRDNR